MKVLIFLGQNVNINQYDLGNSYLIGVDKGASILASNFIKMDLAIGDFDSLAPDDFDKISLYADNIIRLNPIKDDTDTEAALNEALKISNDITIIGGIQGSRIEHMIANICLIKKYPFVSMIDDNSYIFTLNSDYNMNPDEYKFVSIFPLENSIISLNGFKYNLKKYKLNLYDSLGISNEINAYDAKISVHKGQILVIKTKNDLL